MDTESAPRLPLPLSYGRAQKEAKFGETQQLSDPILLSREQIASFIQHGFLILKPSVAGGEALHRTVAEVACQLDAEDELGNNFLPLLPELGEVLDSPELRGALNTLLGEDYVLMPHRHLHVQDTGSPPQPFHRDSYYNFEQFRHSLPIEVMVNYYPQRVTTNMGPTAVLPGSQYHQGCQMSAAMEFDPGRWADPLLEEQMVSEEPGICVVMHYHLWHRATGRHFHESCGGARSVDTSSCTEKEAGNDLSAQIPASRDVLPPRWMFKLQFRRVRQFGESPFTAPLSGSNPYKELCKCRNWITDELPALLRCVRPDRTGEWVARHAPLWAAAWSVLAGQAADKAAGTLSDDQVCSRTVSGAILENLSHKGGEDNVLTNSSANLDCHMKVDTPATPEGLCGSENCHSDCEPRDHTTQDHSLINVDDDDDDDDHGTNDCFEAAMQLTLPQLVQQLTSSESSLLRRHAAAHALEAGIAARVWAPAAAVAALVPVLRSGRPPSAKDHKSAEELGNESIALPNSFEESSSGDPSTSGSHVCKPSWQVRDARWGDSEAQALCAWLGNGHQAFPRPTCSRDPRWFAAAVLQVLPEPLPVGDANAISFAEILSESLQGDNAPDVEPCAGDWRLEALTASGVVLAPEQAVETLTPLLGLNAPRVQLHSAIGLYAAGVRCGASKNQGWQDAAEAARLSEALLDGVQFWATEFAPFAKAQLAQELKRRRCDGPSSPRQPMQMRDGGGRYALAEMLRCLGRFGTLEAAMQAAQSVGADPEILCKSDDDNSWRSRFVLFVERRWLCPITSPFSPF